MTYRIKGLEPAPFAPLFALADAELEASGMTRMSVDNPNFPCRISLRDCAIGDEVILLNHVSHDGVGPYRASHAIFVSKSAAEAADYVDEIPPALDRRILSLRAFDGEGMMLMPRWSSRARPILRSASCSPTRRRRISTRTMPSAAVSPPASTGTEDDDRLC